MCIHNGNKYVAQTETGFEYICASAEFFEGVAEMEGKDLRM